MAILNNMMLYISSLRLWEREWSFGVSVTVVLFMTVQV